MSSARVAGVVEHVLDHVGDGADRELEHLVAFHAQVPDRAGRGRAAVDEELGLVPSVRAQMRGQHAAILARARLLLRFQHDRAGAVAEQHAGAAIGPVENAREGLRADHQRALVHAGAQQAVGGRERVDEARAHRLQVEGRAVVDAERRPGSRPRSPERYCRASRSPTTIRSIDCASTLASASAARAACDAEIGGQSRRPPRCGARGCRCAARSTRRRCRPSATVRRW